MRVEGLKVITKPMIGDFAPTKSYFPPLSINSMSKQLRVQPEVIARIYGHVTVLLELGLTALVVHRDVRVVLALLLEWLPKDLKSTCL